MLNDVQIKAATAQGRVIEPAVTGDPALGDLMLLPGVWASEPAFAGHGWNMIALPFMQPGNTVAAEPGQPGQVGPFRLLLNQFNETLTFTTVDKNVPNRGAALVNAFDADQHVAALQYIQHIAQVAATDVPHTNDTPDRPKAAAAIHHEPGLFLHLFTQTGGGPDIARLATIPHGDVVLAMGFGVKTDGPPDFENIGDFSPLPVGVDADVPNNKYLEPYLNFKKAPFKGNVTAAGFPGFDPTNPLALLKSALPPGNVKTTTTLTLDSTMATGGIFNTPFVVKQASSVSMRAIFWIQELKAPGPDGKPQFVLQYAQRVLLAFFPVGGGLGAGGEYSGHISQSIPCNWPPPLPDPPKLLDKLNKWRSTVSCTTAFSSPSLRGTRHVHAAGAA